jgi:hypothetical protein
MSNRYKIFTTLWFVLGLFALLLNDLLLKEQFSNGFTGKLSDFAGLLIFPLFWTAFFPKHKNKVFLLTALLFILWKSPMSQIFIEGWNSLSFFSISRVVDYTDLYALLILPLAYQLELRKLQLKSIQAKPVIPIFISAFAFGATSYSSQVKLDKSYTLNTPKDSIISRIERSDSIFFVNQRSSINNDTLQLSFPSELCPDNVEVKVVIEDQKDGTTIVRMLDGRYSCPKEKKEVEKITSGFEEKVINKVK